MKKLTLTNSDPQRLDVVLTELLPYSRNQIQKAIKQGAVHVDGETVPTKFPVHLGNLVEFDESYFAPPAPITTPPPKLKKIYEDDDVLVVEKPANLLVHPTDVSHEITLVDSILAEYPEIQGVGENPRRPGIVHRLDKAASGILVIAKTASAYDWLKAQFKERKTKKFYTVLVHGVMTQNQGEITFSIGRSKSLGRMASKPEDQGGKPAKTYYTVREQFPHHALLDVQIVTGRTHQIRVHCFALGHPVVGDPLYHAKNFRYTDIGRLFLHATRLEIRLPNGTLQTFEAPLPDELHAVLEDIPKI